jgi:importin subunit beta-1
MELYDILFFAQNENSEIRQRSEITINDYEKNDPQKFFLELSKIILEENCKNEIRIMAGLILKNRILTDCENKKKEAFKKWFFHISFEIRQEIKKNIIQALNSFYKVIRRTAAQVFSSIVQIEFNHSKGDELLFDLKKYLHYSNYNERIYEAILEIIEFISQDAIAGKIPTITFNQFSEEFFVLIFQAINLPANDLIDLKIAALNAFSSLIEFIGFILKNPVDRDIIFKLLCNQLFSSNQIVRALVFEIFDKMAQNFYFLIENYMPLIFDLTLTTIKNDEERNSIQAIEFWSTIAEKEIEINTKSFQALQEGRIPIEYSRQFIVKSSYQLPIILLDNIKNKNLNQEKEEWNCKNAAIICLNLMCQAAPREIIYQTIPFLSANFNHLNSYRNIECASLVFIAIFDGIGSKVLYEFVYQVLKIFIHYLESTEPDIKNIVSWVIGKICFFNSYSLRGRIIQIFRIFFFMINYDGQIHTTIWSINGFIKYFGKEGILDWCFENISHSIFRLVMNHNRLEERKQELLEIFCSFPLNLSIRQKGYIFSILPLILLKFKKIIDMEASDFSSEIFMLQNSFCRFLNLTVQKYGKKINLAFIYKIIEIIIFLISNLKKFEKNFGLEEELLICIGTLSTSFRKKLTVCLNYWVPFLLNCASDIYNIQISSLSISIIGDTCRAFENDLIPFVEGILNILISILQNNQINKNIKPVILACLGDISYVTVSSSFNYLEFIIPFFKLSFEFEKKSIDFQNFDFFEFYLQLKESILEGISSIIQNSQFFAFQNFSSENLNWIIQFIYQIIQEDRLFRTTKLCLGLIGDLLSSFSRLKIEFQQQKWIFQLLFESRKNKEEKIVKLGNWVENSLGIF